MITKLITRCGVIVSTALAVAACGGGGGGGTAEPPPPVPPVINASFNIELRIDDPELSANTSTLTFGPGTEFASQVNIRITEANGQPVRNLSANGTDDGADLIVTLSLNQGQLGGLSLPGQADMQADSLDLTVDGSGNATAVFYTSDLTGTVELTASATDRDAGQANAAGVFPGVLVTTAQSITIDNSTQPPRPTMTVEASRTTLPANRFLVAPFLGSPYLSEVIVTFRDSFGNLTDPVGSIVSLTVSPVELAGFSTLDDPSTDDNDPDTTNDNEFLTIFGAGPVDVGVDGEATFFVHSDTSPGEARVRISARDPQTQILIEEDLIITIVEPASDGRPADTSLIVSNSLMYIQGSGGLTTQSFDIFVFDGAEELVDDPTTNNNVLLEIFTEGPNSGEFLRSTGLAGLEMQGTSISVATTAGVTNASITTGTEPGFLRLRATADAADNNVENGIQGPVVAETIIDVSDGIPFSVTIADVSLSPLTGSAVALGTNIVDGNALDPLPLNNDAVYQMEVNAIVTDRRGNPPAVPATIQLGLLDAPVIGFPELGRGFFDHSGGDGNPAEGGDSFTALSADFIRPNGTGIGPNDTLVLFGADAPGNEDLEGARNVDVVISDTVVQVDEPFNLNNFTGVSVDNGGAVPWAVGRGMLGNIDTGVQTGQGGVATAFMRYPVSAVGHAAIVFAQGTNGRLGNAGEFNTYGDVAYIAYPGTGTLTLTAAPSTVLANSGATVTVCAADGAGTPIPGLLIDFTFQFQIGTGLVDGVPNQGSVANRTGFDGCTVATITSNGVPAGGDDGVLTFFVDQATAVVDVVLRDNGIIQIMPSAIIGDVGGQVIDIRYIDGTGNPVEGIQIVANCEVMGDGLVTFLRLPGITDANGETDAQIRVAGVDSCDMPSTAMCTFTTATGQPSVVLPITGRDLSVLFSPGPVCPP